MCVHIIVCRLAVNREGKARWRSMNVEVQKRDDGIIGFIRDLRLPFMFKSDVWIDVIEGVEKYLELLNTMGPLHNDIVNETTI